MVLLVAYDLHAPGRDYEPVTRVLQRAREWAHPEGSVWFIDTDESPESWVKTLRGAGDANDEFFVGQLCRNWWSSNLDPEVIAWLKSPARQW